MTNKEKLESLKAQGKILGCDVSAVQGSISWDYVADTYDWMKFGIIKLSDGTWIDSKFDHNYRTIRQTRLAVGIYVVIHPDKDPVPQARKVIDTLRQYGEPMANLILIDFETSYSNAAKTTENIKLMMKMFDDELKKYVAIYSYQGFAQPFMGPLGPDTKWAIANYSVVSPPHPGISEEQLVLKQFSGWVPYNGCPGMSGGVICRRPDHDHGIALKLSAKDPGTPIDIDVINSDDMWFYFRSFDRK